MIAILGDIHFSNHKPWFTKVSEYFLDWFSTWNYNTPGNSLILAGDLVQTHINGGHVIGYIERLVASSSFDNIYICVGNHDKKKVNGHEELAYEFLKYKKNVFIYEEATGVTIEGKKVLFLPYYLGNNSEGLTMKQQYSQIYKNDKFKGPWDLVVGHFSGADVSFNSSPDCIENLEKINTKRLCLGHIHTREVNPSVYIGSIYAGRRNENDYSRAAWILKNENWIEDKLPLFNEFITVSYPNKIRDTKALVPIYTILNCSNEQSARDLYGKDIFIRRVTSSNIDFSSQDKYEQSRIFSNVRNLNIEDLFDEFVKSQNIPINEMVIKQCRSLIKKKEN